MALQKQPITINFSKGLDQKTDPFQVPIGNFLRLRNNVFTKGGQLTKRNGYAELPSLPESVQTLTTFDNNLTAIGSNLISYAAGSGTWVNKGSLQPISLETQSLVRNNYNQIQVDAVVAPNGIACTVYTETGSGTTRYKYALSDSTTGQNILPPTLIPNTGTITHAPRVFVLGNNFIILFGNTITGTDHLQYVSISFITPVAPTTAVNVSSQFTPSASLAFDAVVSNNNLYIAWNGSDVGGAIRTRVLDSHLALSSTKTYTGFNATTLSSGSSAGYHIYVTWYDSGTNDSFMLVYDLTQNQILAPTQVLNNVDVLNITVTALDTVATILYEVDNDYSYGSEPTHYVGSVTCTEAGVVGTPAVLVRSLGLASKAFLYNDNQYFMGVYDSDFQPSYFLINSLGEIVSRLAYSNGGGYLVNGLPNVTSVGNVVQIPYQFKDLLVSANKSQGVSTSASVYSQTGINLVSFTFGAKSQTSEIGGDLLLTGGMLWMFDGVVPVEQGFLVWPDNIAVNTITTGGYISDQQYFYQVTYEWSDNQGNIYRSAPSVPVEVTTTGGDTSSNTLDIPTLRLTYKIDDPVKIVIYRWSTNQQVYYQITSITAPLLNNPTVDSIQYVDTQADTDILGNSIIYTTGGVLENISAPSFNDITLFDSRLWGIDAEDPDQLLFSKKVIQGVPVEMTDLLSYFVSPTTGAQASTGPNRCLFPMDEKLIIFKSSACYYVNGTGPDSTGANSQYSEPVFISGTVGCSNPDSIVMIPDGLMFESNNGIWLLGRGLGTAYIGAPVEDFTQEGTVLSAINVPGTTQVRFTLSSGVTLMYDYYYQQWGEFANVPAISSTVYNSLHTYVDSYNRVFQESPGRYLDGSNPVLQGLTTSWIATGGLQGYQRLYFLQLLGSYISPHKLNIQIAYDFDSSIHQSVLIEPQNSPTNWGSEQLWGSGDTWGGPTNVEQEQVFFERQKCTSFQLSIDEIFDPQFGTAAGAGLTLSGLNLTIGVKKTYSPTAARNQHG